MVDIAKKIQKDKSTVTALVNKLVKLGYVQRKKCLCDSRITYLFLTSKGKELQPLFYQVSKVLLETTYKNFSQKEREEVMNALEKMENNY